MFRAASPPPERARPGPSPRFSSQTLGVALAAAWPRPPSHPHPGPARGPRLRPVPPAAQARPLTGRSCAGPAPSGLGGRWRCCSCAAASGPRRGTRGQPRAAPCGSGGRGSRRRSPGSTRTGLRGHRGGWGGPDLRPHLHRPPRPLRLPPPTPAPAGPRAQLLPPPALPPPPPRDRLAPRRGGRGEGGDTGRSRGRSSPGLWRLPAEAPRGGSDGRKSRRRRRRRGARVSISPNQRAVAVARTPPMPPPGSLRGLPGDLGAVSSDSLF